MLAAGRRPGVWIVQNVSTLEGWHFYWLCVWHPSRVRRVMSLHPRVVDPRLLSCDPFRVLVTPPKSI